MSNADYDPFNTFDAPPTLGGSTELGQRDADINSIVRELQLVGRQPGIYFDLEADLYHADPALGSTDIRSIRKEPRRYQLASFMTPKHKRYSLQTKATVMGSALHTIVLDGVEDFSRKYIRRPDSYDTASTSEKSAITKAMNAKLVEGQDLLHTHEYDLCLDAAQLIVNHKDLNASLTGSEHEVSVFWRHPDNGVPLKARFDILKPNGIGDIKTIENERGDRLDVAAGWAIKNYRYDIQAAHYMIGRMQFRRLVAQGAVYLGDGHKATVGAKFFDFAAKCAAAPTYGFEFIFLQKSIPEVWACVLSPQNRMIALAAGEANDAVIKFNDMLDRYGTSPWPQEWKLGELHIEDIPGGDNGWR